MGSNYRRSKIVLNAFRGFTSRIFPLKSPIQNPRNTLLGLAPKSNKAKLLSGFSSYPIIPWKKSVSHYFGLTRTQYSPFHGCGAKRYYHVDPYHQVQVQHFKPSRPWFQNPRNKVMISVLGGSGTLAATVYFWNLETIPYTKRTHLVLLSKKLERKLGDFLFEVLNNNDKFKSKILPTIHPKSVRVRSISNHIIKALQDKLGDYGLNWDVVVVDDPNFDAFYLPGGKIVIYTGVLKHLISDAEIATVIAHEAGHGLARHGAEYITNYFTKYMWLGILQFILNLFVNNNNIVNKQSNLLLKLPRRRRNEFEADYIGMMLIASAGYDPRVAPKVFRKLVDLEDSSMREDLSTHPSGNERAQFLAQPKVMEEALLIYSKKMREQSRTLELKRIS